ncbi:MAG: acetate kinase [Candidatus Jacksonbacteria bacterium]|nr:acetate kinase [Candidatus Jacksonbacteria bacterium]
MILSINAGSTSLKYRLFANNLSLLAGEDFQGASPTNMLFRRISSVVEQRKRKGRLCVAHRVVHGGPHLRAPVKITPYVVKTIRSHSSLAPLHNPYNLKAIGFAQKFFGDAMHCAVFDTGFFRTLPLVSEMYPLPLSLYRANVHKYGFHGIAHEYCLHEAKRKLGKTRPNIISAHLGGGCSMSAIQKGRAIDTSMGYSPLEGLMMWSRAGDIDPGIIVSSKFKVKSSKYWNNVLNHESGLKGISGCKNYLELLKKYYEGDRYACLAFEMFVYRIQKYIGAYFAALHGDVDAIVLSGKIGAGDSITRKAVYKGLPFLKSVKKLVVQPNEEWMMAKLARDLQRRRG